MSKEKPSILITPGEPAGIGPDILIKMAQETLPAGIVAVCDPDLLLTRAKLLGLSIRLVENQHNDVNLPGTLKIIPVKMPVPAIPGELNIKNAEYVMQCLQIACDLCLQKQADAMVTGPVNKSIINQAGIAFTGHTEFLAERCNVSSVIMLFVVGQLKVALMTIHIPLSQVPQAINRENLMHTVRLLNTEIQKKFQIAQPRMLVCGLNPHAGENGLLGHEEIEVIAPVIAQCQKEKIDVTGPYPADTIFTSKYSEKADVILAMYHDQALPVVKYAGFHEAVNMTLGLPIIRTSVDHGTALDIAGSGQAHPGSLKAAILLASALVNGMIGSDLKSVF